MLDNLKKKIEVNIETNAHRLIIFTGRNRSNTNIITMEGYKPYQPLEIVTQVYFYPTVTSLIKFIHSLMVWFFFLKEEQAVILKIKD